MPTNLQGSDTFVVDNQIRTVNCNRFIALKENFVRIDCTMNDEQYKKVIELCLNQINVYDDDDKLEYFSKQYMRISVKMLLQSAYKIKKLIKEDSDELEIHRLKDKIKHMI